MQAIATINPFYAARLQRRAVSGVSSSNEERKSDRFHWAKLPLAPITGSPVPELTSLYHNPVAGDYGDRSYPGNCSGNLIKDLLRYFRPRSVLDPMTGSGTCKDVCDELGIYCLSGDLKLGADACEPGTLPKECFQFCWIHPPYWRMKRYSDDPRDLSTTPTLAAFLDRYQSLITNCADALTSEGKLAILMGDYSDRDYGYVPLVFWTKYLAMKQGLRQHCTDIIRFSHGNSSSRKRYRSKFIPGLHDVCMIFEKTTKKGVYR